jgi:hypothetical protein
MDVKDWLRVHWDRALAWTLVTAGVVVLLFGWDGVASTPFPAEQMSYLVSGGIGGGLMIVVGAALLISADLRDEWHKLDRIERLLRDAAEPDTGDGAVTPLHRAPEDRLRATGS